MCSQPSASPTCFRHNSNNSKSMPPALHKRFKCAVWLLNVVMGFLRDAGVDTAFRTPQVCAKALRADQMPETNWQSLMPTNHTDPGLIFLFLCCSPASPTAPVPALGTFLIQTISFPHPIFSFRLPVVLLPSPIPSLSSITSHSPPETPQPCSPSGASFCLDETLAQRLMQHVRRQQRGNTSS